MAGEKEALKKLVDSGTITPDQGNTVYTLKPFDARTFACMMDVVHLPASGKYRNDDLIAAAKNAKRRLKK
jgi:hypothetical protein